METKYPLYYTLNGNIPKTKPTKVQIKNLARDLAALDEDAKVAVVMLIAEHSKISNESVYEGEDIEIPYSGLQKEDGTEFDLNNFPNSLIWILIKFVGLRKK